MDRNSARTERMRNALDNAPAMPGINVVFPLRRRVVAVEIN